MADHPDFGSFRLLPFLFHHLKAQDIEDPLMMKSKGIARRNWYKNQKYFRSLEHLLRALHQADIDCMFLCGSTFALNYHRDYTLDAEANLTILIPLEQMWIAFKQLQIMGWQPAKQLLKPVLTPYLAANWLHIFQDAAGRKIYLHWHLLPVCRTVEADTDFWDGAITAAIHVVPVHILNPADQLLYSCVEDHSSYELSNFLRVIDVMLIIRATPDLDWDRLISQAKKHRLVVPLIRMLSYIQDTLKDPLPPTIWQQLRSLPISWREQLEYRLRSSNLLLGRHFWKLGFNYRRHTEGDSLAQSLLGFPRYLQHYWLLPTLGQVPGKAMSILRQHLPRRFSLSRSIV